MGGRARHGQTCQASAHIARGSHVRGINAHIISRRIACFQVAICRASRKQARMVRVGTPAMLAHQQNGIVLLHSRDVASRNVQARVVERDGNALAARISSSIFSGRGMGRIIARK